MKKMISAALCLVCLSVSVLPALANSAPSYWESYPYSEVLAIDEDSPVAVSSEKLTFDFSGEHDYATDYSPVARVTADYQMVNPTGDPVQVQMAFPFVASLTALSIPDISISADDQALPYEIFLDPGSTHAGGSADSEFTYGGIGDISNTEKTLTGFDLNAPATLYRFSLDSGEDPFIDFKLSLQINSEQTVMVLSGFNAYSVSEAGDASLSARVIGQMELDVLILGVEPVFQIGMYSAMGKELSAGECQFKQDRSSAVPRDYLLDAMREAVGAEAASVISDTQLMNLCVYSLEQYSDGTGFATLSDILSTVHNDRIITLVYEVEFPAQATRQLCVSYLTDGTMDRTKTISPQYHYTYLLSPAAGWARFDSLDIELITPNQVPYLVESNLSFTSDGAQHYVSHVDGLPGSELTFTLYEKEKVTALDLLQKKFYTLSYLLFIFWPLFAIVAVILVLAKGISVLRRRRREKRGK